MIQHFGEVYVHIEKRYGLSKRTRMDFFVYSPDGNFGVDVFYTDTEHSFKVNCHNKMKKYTEFQVNTDLYFLCLNNNIDQAFMDKQSLVMSHFRLYSKLHFVNIDSFHKIVASKKRYPDPEGFLSNNL